MCVGRQSILWAEVLSQQSFVPDSWLQLHFLDDIMCLYLSHEISAI